MGTIGTKTAYKAPRVKVVEVNVRSVLCQSPTVNDWDEGSNSDGGDMMEEE